MAPLTTKIIYSSRSFCRFLLKASEFGFCYSWGLGFCQVMGPTGNFTGMPSEIIIHQGMKVPGALINSSLQIKMSNELTLHSLVMENFAYRSLNSYFFLFFWWSHWVPLEILPVGFGFIRYLLLQAGGRLEDVGVAAALDLQAWGSFLSTTVPVFAEQERIFQTEQRGDQLCPLAGL